MADSWSKDLFDAVGEMAEWKLPLKFSAQLIKAANSSELAEVIRDIIVSVPGFLDLPLHLIAQRFNSRGTQSSRIIGILIDLIPPMAEEIREKTGLTQEQARKEVAKKFMEKVKLLKPTLDKLKGELMSDKHPTPPATATATTTKTAAPTAKTESPAVLKTSLSKIQQVLGKTDGLFDEQQRQVILYMFRILRIEAQLGSDIVAEIEGEARSAKSGLIDTLVENAADFKAALQIANFKEAHDFYKIMRKQEMTGDITSTNEVAWRLAAAGFVRALIPAFEFVLLGQAEKHHGTAMSNQLGDAMDRINLFAGLKPSSKFLDTQKIRTDLRMAARVMSAMFASLIIYGLITVGIAGSSPDWLAGWALWSLVLSLGSAAAAIIIAAIGDWVVIGVLAIFFTFYIVPTELIISLAIALVFAPTPDWQSWWLLMAVGVGFDLIACAIAQKAINLVGGIPEFFLGFLKNDHTRAREMAEKISQDNFLVNISATIAGALLLVELPMLVAMIFGISSRIASGGIAAIALFALIYGYQKRGLAPKNYETSYKDKDVGKQFKNDDLAHSRWARISALAVTIAVLVFFALVAFFGTDTLQNAKEHARNGIVRTAGVSLKVADKGMSKVEEVVGVKDENPNTPPSQPTVTEEPESEKPKLSSVQRKAEFRAKLGGDSYCNWAATQPDLMQNGKQTYPCD